MHPNNAEHEIVKAANADQEVHIDVPEDAPADPAPAEAAPAPANDAAPEAPNPPAQADVSSDSKNGKAKPSPSNFWLIVGISVAVLVGYFCLAAWRPDTFSPSCSRSFFAGLRSGAEAPSGPNSHTNGGFQLPQNKSARDDVDDIKEPSFKEPSGANSPTKAGMQLPQNKSARDDVREKCVNHTESHVEIKLKVTEERLNERNYGVKFRVSRAHVSKSKETRLLTLRYDPSMHTSHGPWRESKTFYNLFDITNQHKGRMKAIAKYPEDRNFVFLSPFEKLNDLEYDAVIDILKIKFSNQAIDPDYCGCPSCSPPTE